MSDYLSILPIELIEYIFDYLSIFDILSSIYFVNKRLYSICLIYSHFRLDFNCIAKKKKQFEFICNQLPNLASRIFSLDFGNDKSDRITNAKFNRFFSSITMNNIFSNLYSITLNHIDSKIWNLIRTRLSLFISLKSISMNSTYDSSKSTSILVSLIFHDILFTVKSLKHLYLHVLYCKNEIINISSSSLIQTLAIESLTVKDIAINLREIFSIAPMLRQLDTVLINTQFNDMNMIFQSSIYLQKLSITINSLTMFEIKHLLSSMISLTHLSLDVYNVDNNMINGNAWIPLMTRIVIFQFIFQISNDINIDLDSFRTQFWLEEKKWYVTYDQETDMYRSFLYTNPYFKEYHCSYVYGKKILTESTGLEPTTYPYVKNLSFDTKSPMPEIYLRRFTYADTLIIKNNFNNSLEYITSFIDLSRITNFIQDGLKTKVLNNKFIEILYNLPYLRSLDLYFSTLILLFDRRWPQIINLTMEPDSYNQIKSLSSKQIDALWCSFPHLEQLNFYRRSIRNLSKLFKTMTMTLSNICICYYDYMHNLNLQMVTRQWLEKNTKLRHFEYFQNDKKVYIWL